MLFFAPNAKQLIIATRAPVARASNGVYSRSQPGSRSTRLAVGRLKGSPPSAPVSPASVETKLAIPLAP